MHTILHFFRNNCTAVHAEIRTFLRLRRIVIGGGIVVGGFFVEAAEPLHRLKAAPLEPKCAQIGVQTSAPAKFNGAYGDTLEIRSGAPNTAPARSADLLIDAPEQTSGRLPKQDARQDTLLTRPVLPKKKLSREEILKISFEELLDLPMETVLEYAKVLDSAGIMSATGNQQRINKKNKRLSTDKNSNDTQALDKLNASLQQERTRRHEGKQSSSSGATETAMSREELLRTKLKDLLDMRLGEILRLVSPVLVSSATNGVQQTQQHTKPR